MKGTWISARSLWMKFCGIADEYKMLRDRWLYLYEEDKVPILPYLRAKDSREESQTFDLLDNHVKKLESDEMFGELGFNRKKMEDYHNFSEKLNNIDRNEIHDKLELIEDFTFDLATFIGLLKNAFFQRTVSFEISHVASGMPHSPERTIGNELFYLAADNVARNYYNCLSIPYGVWDGFITFTPPISETHFYGGFFRPSENLRLFHISMSEEAKYFVGSYLALAHEFAHGCIAIRKSGLKNWIDKPVWFKVLTGLIMTSTFDLLDKKEGCENCPLYDSLFSCIQGMCLETYQELCEELLADIIACYIGGENYVFEFLSITSKPTYPFLLRVLPTVAYLNAEDLLSKNTSKILYQRVEKIVSDKESLREDEGIYCPDGEHFSQCVYDIGSLWASIIYEFNKTLERNVLETLEGMLDDVILSVSRINNYIGEIRFKGSVDDIDERLLDTYDDAIASYKDYIHSNWPQLFPVIIKNKFDIEKSKEDEIVDALLRGVPVPKEEPRHILHCYYEAFHRSEGKERPNYAATIYSLAYNKHKI